MSLLAWGDIFLFILAGLIFFLTLRGKGNFDTGTHYELYVNDSMLASLPLEEGEESYDVGSVEFTVRSSDSSVGFVNSSCPSQICVHSPEISRPGEEIICLPGRTVLRIKGERSGDADIISR